MQEHNTNRFAKEAKRVAIIVNEKNLQYGNSFEKSGEILKILYPTGIGLEHYDEMLTVIRIIDKLFRIATGHSSDNEDPWQDICGYALLELEKKSRELSSYKLEN